MSLSEFQLIDTIRNFQPNFSDDIEGIGDDAAIIPVGQQSFVITTDSLVENIHFKMEWASPFQIGRKSAAVNLSDVAAMGAQPFGLFLSISVPKTVDYCWIEQFILGIKTFGVPILGGDTTSSKDSLFINITAIGKVDNNSIKRRSTAKSGDDIYVTGTLGDSGAGLYILQNNLDPVGFQSLVEAHLNPSPQLKIGTELAELREVHSMMDISDGLAGDIHHILDQSGLSATIDCDKLPISESLRTFCNKYDLDPIRFALEAGEDYQLLFSAEKKKCLPLPCVKVGELYTGPGQVKFLNSPSPDYKYTGYTHF